MTLNFTSAKDSIKNYSQSELAKSENKDCVVRAFAAACDWEYDKAHRFVEKEFGRKPKKGTPRFMSTMSKLVSEGRRPNRKKIRTIQSETRHSSMTVGSFVKDYDRGTYILVIRGHAFTIKDGQVVGGNLEDSKRMRCIIKGAWKIG
jgi:hypothetical protein